MSFTQGPLPPQCLNSRRLLMEHIHQLYPQVILVCFRNTNANVVVYEAQLSGGRLRQDVPVIGYWLILEPRYRQARRRQSLTHDREEFSGLDYLAWDFKATPREFMFKALPELPLKLGVSRQGRPGLIMHKDGQKYLVRALEIEAHETMLQQAVLGLGQLLGAKSSVVKSIDVQCIHNHQPTVVRVHPPTPAS